MKISSCWKIPTATASASCRSQARTEQSSRQTRPEARVIPVQPVVRVLSRPRVAYPELSPCSEGMGPRVHLTAGCGDIDPCRSPCTCERLSTPSTEGYARIMLRGSTTLKTAVVGPTRAERGFAMRVIAASANIHEVLQHQGGQSGEIASARTRFVRVTSGWLRRHGRCRSAQQQSSADSGLLQGGRRTIHVRYKWRRGRWSHNREHEQHPTRGGYGYVHV